MNILDIAIGHRVEDNIEYVVVKGEGEGHIRLYDVDFIALPFGCYSLVFQLPFG
jgi:hypothetical protein